jgi:hypothetical protein
MGLVSWFEIPVTDLDRAVAFYEAVLGTPLEREVVDGHAMALFPGPAGPGTVSGALAHGDSYVPSLDGTRVYFRVDDLGAVLDRAVAEGAHVLYPRTVVGDDEVAEVSDSEGNRIALLAARTP